MPDWVHRFNADGPEGLFDHWTNGPTPRLSPEQLSEFARIVEAGLNREQDRVVRWCRVDLQREIKERFDVAFHERYVETLLKNLGFDVFIAMIIVAMGGLLIRRIAHP